MGVPQVKKVPLLFLLDPVESLTQLKCSPYFGNIFLANRRKKLGNL